MRAKYLLPALASALALSTWAAPVQDKQQPVLDRIRATGTITFAYRESSVPFSYLGANNKPVGYAMDLCMRVAEAVKKNLGLPSLAFEYVPVTPATRMDVIAQGKADLECGSTTNNLERRQKVAFTVPHYIAGARYMVRADSTINQLPQFEGGTLVSTKGTTPLKAIDQANRERLLRIRILEAPDHARAVSMVERGEADGFAMDDVLLYGLLATVNDPASFVVTAEPLSVEPYGIGLRKGDAEFKKLADDTLIALFKTGEIHVIYRKWFESTIPPQQINLRRPMSTALANAIARPTDSGDPADYR